MVAVCLPKVAANSALPNTLGYLFPKEIALSWAISFFVEALFKVMLELFTKMLLPVLTSPRQ